MKMLKKKAPSVIRLVLQNANFYQRMVLSVC